MREILDCLASGEDLTEKQAEQAMHAMMAGTVSAVFITGYLTLLRGKGETIAELTGSARAMRDHALTISVDTAGVIDTCGTGGDHSGTFNISTAASFVAAAAGVRVAKHGNRAASSLTGSADVLSALGVDIELTPEAAAKSLADTGFCFLFAQAYHPAMKHVASIRKELGYRTMFNILGPLTNPVRPKRQVLGTPSAVIAEKMAHVLAALGCEHALVLSATDGLDEVSVGAPTSVYEVRAGKVHAYMIGPDTFGLQTHSLAAIKGGDAQVNAGIIQSVFAGERGARRDIVVANAAAALYVAGAVSSLFEGARMAERLLDDGEVATTLQRVAAYSRKFAKGVGA